MIIGVPLLLGACTSASQNFKSLSGPELEVLAAVAADPYLRLHAPGMDQRPVISATTDLSFLQRSDSNLTVHPTFKELESDQTSEVPSSLLATLDTANKSNYKIERNTIADFPIVNGPPWPPGITRIVVLSRPAITADGNAAVVSVRREYPQPHLGPDGYAVYLEHTGGEWRVVRHGAHWIV